MAIVSAILWEMCADHAAFRRRALWIENGLTHHSLRRKVTSPTSNMLAPRCEAVLMLHVIFLLTAETDKRILILSYA